jgi:tetratricopeptide (TPR) repeat protein
MKPNSHNLLFGERFRSRSYQCQAALWFGNACGDATSRLPRNGGNHLAVPIIITLIAFSNFACHRTPAPQATSPTPKQASRPAETAPVPGSETSMTAVRFLEDRVKSDPDDLVALNKLASYYLQLHRETSDVKYLELSMRAARSSLRVAGADQNLTGLLALAQAEFATHDFVSARDHAKELTEYAPSRSAAYLVLGDALLELGDYDGAKTNYDKVVELDHDEVGTEARLAHLSALRGDLRAAERRYAAALSRAKTALVPTAEPIAWCHWQLGEMAFQTGDLRGAERRYQDALNAYPNYVRAVASLGRVRAALGDSAGGIQQYEKAMRIIPDPMFAAALGDLYKLTGRSQEAAQQYTLVEQIGRLNEFNGSLYNRQLILFYADHDLKPAEAYQSAAQEYLVRRDIYGADALAWSALKAGKTAEARSAIKDALRLGTIDARLFYHAGLIAQAAGDHTSAHEYLQKALSINPKFDPLQSEIARRKLAETEKSVQ